MLVGMLIGQVHPTRTIKTPDSHAGKIDDVRIGWMDRQVLAVPRKGLIGLRSGNRKLGPRWGGCPGIVSAKDSERTSILSPRRQTDIKAVGNTGRDGDSDAAVAPTRPIPGSDDARPIRSTVRRAVDAVGCRS